MSVHQTILRFFHLLNIFVFCIYCGQISQYLTTFGVVYSFLGGTSIALMRVLYVKMHWVILNKEMKVALALVGLTLVTCTVLSVVYETVTKRTASLIDICFGRPQELVIVMFDMEFQNRFNYQVHTVVWVGFATVVVEICCYAVIYIHLIRHNLSMTLVLSRDNVRRQNKRNVINLTGHAVNFSLEMFFLLFFSVDGTVPRELQFLNRVIGQSHYCLIGISTFVFSDSMRAELFSMVEKAVVYIFKIVGFFNFMGIFGSFYQRNCLYRR